MPHTRQTLTSVSQSTSLPRLAVSYRSLIEARLPVHIVLPRSSPVRSKLKLGPNLCYTSSHRCTPVQLGHNCPISSREQVTLWFSHGPMPAQLTGFMGSHRVTHSRGA